MKIRFRQFLLGLSFVLSFQTQAQIICTDVNPDIVATGNSTVDIDLNNDATVDFRLTGALAGGLGFVIVQAGQVGTNNFVLTNGSGSASCLPLNTPIGSTSTTWTQMNGTNQQMMTVFSGVGSGLWSGVTDQYLGLQFAVGTNTYYGWAKLSFSNSSNTYTLKEYAYNSSVGQPILSGQGCGSLGSPTFPLPVTGCTGNILNLVANTGTATASTYTWIASPATASFSSPGSATTDVTFTASGVYSLALVVMSGTTIGYATNTINIAATPTISVSPTATSVCFGMSSILTASGAGSYSWTPSVGLSSTSGPTVIASNLPGIINVYTVTGTIGSCLSSTQVVVTYVQPPTVYIGSSSGLPALCPGYTLALTGFGANTYTWTSSTFSAPIIQTSVAVSSPGIYTVIGMDQNGCTNVDSISITADSPLNIDISNPEFTTCIAYNFPKISKSFSISAIGASTYSIFPYSQWNQQPTPGNFLVRFNANTCFTVVGWTAACSGTSILCATVMPQSTVAINPAFSATLCSGESVALNVSNPTGVTGPFTYSWTESLASPLSLNSYSIQTVQASPVANTSYTVSVQDADGCVSEDAMVNLIVQTCAGVNELDHNLPKLVFYPNPAQDKLIFENNSGVWSLEIVSLSGQKLKTYVTDAESIFLIPVDDLNPGVYLLKYKTKNDNAELFGRFIKE